MHPSRLFDLAAMTVYPWLARARGYVFRVGVGRALEDDGHAVLAAVWGARGIEPPADAAAVVSARYDRATTWIVAYHRGEPVGVMGLLDMRVACISLDYDRRALPPDLPLDRTREIARLAILPAHRGGAQTVMIGLLREMLAWSEANGIERLFSGSTPRLYAVYARYNPSARRVEAPPAPPEDPVTTRYFAPLRAYGGPGVHFTFEARGARPWSVFSRFLARGGAALRRRVESAERA